MKNLFRFTVNISLQALLKADFLRTLTNGVYCINPDIFKGRQTSRLNVLRQYNNTKQDKISDGVKIANLEKFITTAQKRALKIKI